MDAVSGSDANTGRAPAGHCVIDGPKQTVAAGLGLASDNGLIIVADGAYDESSISLNSKDLTIRMTGPVTVR